ncbi:MAG: Tol-Pal system protein TolB [Rhodobacteraceae bacterium]|nr:Tol-Pal system protein TolB [Paracoccaceae bacterium]
MPRQLIIACLLAFGASMTHAQSGPLRIEITEGVIEPVPVAIPRFIAETAAADTLAGQLTELVTADLVNSGLFRAIPADAHIGRVTNFNAPVQYADWKVINVHALITGAVTVTDDNQMVVSFRLFDIFSQNQMEGLQFAASTRAWRRIGHKIADRIYARLTGEQGYFDSRIVYIAEEGPKDARKKRLAVMDYDGANNRYLTDSSSIVLAPRFSPNAREIIYTSYETGVPQVFLMNVDTLRRRLIDQDRNMSFAPRFSPDGQRAIMSLSDGRNSDIYSVDLATGQKTRLTRTPAIETAPGYSPDGSRIVFESDRGGGQQIYVMGANGGNAQRISRGEGRYATPVWSPRGDLIAFTKILNDRFHIGVMRTDGSGERLLTGSRLEEGPTWSPNGRVIMFFREIPGADGGPIIYSVNVTGQNLRKVPTPTFGSDPAWSNLLE